MKQALTILSWIAVVLGTLSIISGLTKLATDPTNAYYSLLGGVLFFAEGLAALMYINEKK